MGVLSITGGMLLGAGIWGAAKAGWRVVKKIVKGTKTKKDDAIVERVEVVGRALADEPELLELVEKVLRKL